MTMDGRSEGPTPSFQPIRLLEVELSQALPAVMSVAEDTGQTYGEALSLVRLHTQPLGLVKLDFGEGGLSTEEYARRIWATLHTEILQHLKLDGLPAISTLPPEGLPDVGAPCCLTQREQALAGAPLVSVVVPTHDRPVQLQSCLASLEALEYPQYEIIVVDNAPSTLEIAQLVKSACAKVPGVRYVREDRPGASWARNRGLLESRGEIVAFTDDDVAVDRYWLAEIVKAFRSAKNVGCVTGNVLPRLLDTPAQAWFEARGGFSRGFVRGIYDRVEHIPNHRLYPYCAMIFGSGNNMAFRSTVLKRIGGFDPTLDPASPTLGGEDLAAFFEVILGGFKLVYEPAAFVRHLHRRDYDGLHRQMHAWGIGFTAYLLRTLVRHPGLLPDFTRRLPKMLAVLLSGNIPYNRMRVESLTRLFPAASSKELWRAENVGYVHGVPAYVQSLLHVRRVKRRYGALKVCEAVDA